MGQSGPGNDGNKGVLCILQSCNSVASPSDCLVSHLGHSVGRGLIPLQRCSQCILQPQPTGPDLRRVIYSTILFILLNWSNFTNLIFKQSSALSCEWLVGWFSGMSTLVGLFYEIIVKLWSSIS